MKTSRLITLAALSGLFSAASQSLAQTWSPTSAPVTNWVSLASSGDGTKLVAAAAQPFGPPGPIFVSTNAGATWMQTGAPITNWTSVASSADGLRLVASAGSRYAEFGGIYTSADAGVTWTQTSAPITNWTAIASSVSGSNLVAVSGYGSIFTSANAGATWTEQPGAPFGQWLAVASSADGTRLIVAGCYCGILTFSPVFISTNSGVSWAGAGVSSYSPFAASSSDGKTLLIGDYNAGISVSTNFGASWTHTNAFGGGPAAASADGSRLAVLNYQLVLSSDSGATWATLSSPSLAWKGLALSADGSRLFAAANGGGIYTLNLGQPQIFSQAVNETLVANLNFNLQVSAIGNPPLTYQWKHNGLDVSGATNSELTLTNLMLSDSGAYSVWVSNGFGSATATNYITVVPAVVSTQPPTNLSTNSATLNGFLSHGSNDTYVWFEWGANTNYGNATPEMAIGSAALSANFSNSISALAPTTTYHFRAVASNAAGIVFGEERNLTVPAPPFTRTSAPATNWTAIASSADGTRLAASIQSSRIYLSTNAGLTWATSTAPMLSWSALAASADGQRIIGVTDNGDSGEIHISTNGGNSWQLNNVNNGPWSSAASSADGKRLFVIGAYWMRSSTNGGATWTLADASPSYYRSAIACSADGRTVVALKPGVTFVSTDSGVTWTQYSSLIYGWPSLTCSADGSRWMAARYDGGIFVSTNRGFFWEQTVAPTAYWSSIDSSADGRVVSACIFGGGIYTSLDFGETWASNSVPSNVWYSVACSSDGAKIFTAGSAGIYAAQSTPAPLLKLRRAGTNAAISWLVPSATFTLQENSDLMTTNWADVATTPVLNLTNLHQQTTLPLLTSNRFFRLKH